MIMRRVVRVNSCHRPLAGYALALTMSDNSVKRRRCGNVARHKEGEKLMKRREFIALLGGAATTHEDTGRKS